MYIGLQTFTSPNQAIIVRCKTVIDLHLPDLTEIKIILILNANATVAVHERAQDLVKRLPSESESMVRQWCCDQKKIAQYLSRLHIGLLQHC